MHCGGHCSSLLLLGGAPDGALGLAAPFLLGVVPGRRRGREEVGVNHDVAESFPALAPTAQALRVELQRLEPEPRLFRVVALRVSDGLRGDVHGRYNSKVYL